MSKFFEPKDLSISGLFKDGDPIYKIPNYQRPYSWEDEQVEALWDDIYDAYKIFLEEKEKNQNYFLGSLIVVATDKAKTFDVVDGQQRLTTLMILFNVIKNLYPDLNKNVDAELSPDVIKYKHIESCIYNDNEAKRLTFYTDAKHRNVFSEKILQCSDFKLFKQPKKIQGVEDRYINTAYIFANKLLEIENEIGTFVNYLFNRVMIIKITCQDTNFAIKLFQVLNNRGLDLSQADLIKANLISKISDEENKEAFIATWRDIESKIETLDISFSDIFTFQQNYLLAANPKKSLNQELESLFLTKNSNDVITETLKICNFYSELFYSEDKDLYGLWYLPWDIVKSIYISIYLSNYSERTQLIKKIQRFYYLFWIAGFTYSPIKQISYNIIKWVKAHKSLSEIEQELESKLNEHKVIQNVKEILASNDVYNKKWIKPIFCLLEYVLREKSDFIYWDRKLQVEHILPQKFHSTTDWEHIDNSIGNEYLNTLGNLTLLSDLKNPEAKNYSFAKKLYVYSGKGLDGKQQKGWTQYQITQELVNKHNTPQPQWDISDICERREKILNSLYTLFEIN